MPEIKNNFLKGRMNKDLDERLIPNGEYRDAMNIQISTSEGSDVGTVQNILGNMLHNQHPSGVDVIPADSKCIGAVADEKNNKLYWFIKKEFNPLQDNFEAIVEFTPGNESIPPTVEPVIIDTKVGTADAVLKFPERIITGINVIDNLIFWTDGEGEPKKINIDKCKAGTVINLNTMQWAHTQLVFEKGGFNGCYVFDVSRWQGNSSGPGLFSRFETNTLNLTQRNGGYGAYGYIQKAQLESITDPFPVNHENTFSARHYRDGEYLATVVLVYLQTASHVTIRINSYDLSDTSDQNPGTTDGNYKYGDNIPYSIKVGDIFYPNRDLYSFTGENDIKEEHITVIKKKPTNKLNVKINTSLKSKGQISYRNHAKGFNKTLGKDNLLFENLFPRFSYRYKYVDNEYSAFAPFTEVVFNPEHKEGYNQNNYYNADENYNTSMVNTIDSIELTDFITAQTPKDVVQVDILYKREDSPIIYSIASIKHDDNEWHNIGSNLYSDIGYNKGINNNGGQRAHVVYGDKNKGRFIVDSENISNALPENQSLRTYDNVPLNALAQEVTGNRIVYGNYVQGYTPKTKIPKLISSYNPRSKYDNFYFFGKFDLNKGKQNIKSKGFSTTGLPSIKSQRNYQLGIAFLDEYGRETPVFSSSESAVKVPWRNKYGSISSTQSQQLNVTITENPPSFAKYMKYFVKETSTEYYNLLMDDVYVPSDHSTSQDKRFIYASFASSERNKITEDSYIILKKKLDTVGTVFEKENKFKVLDIEDNAPDFVKYEYLSYGKVSQKGGYQTGTSTSYLNSTLMTNTSARPSSTLTSNLGTDVIVMVRSKWKDARGMHFAYGDDSEVTSKVENLYFSFFKHNGPHGIQRSKRYRIIDIRLSSSAYAIKLEERISFDDMNLAKQNPGNMGDDTIHANLVIEVEERKLRKEEDYSGKFFVKLKSDDLTINDFSNFYNPTQRGGNLSQYTGTGSKGLFLAVDNHQPVDNQYWVGIQNSNAFHNIGSNVHPSRHYSYAQVDWADTLNDFENNSTTNYESRFFIDGLHMIAGQISDNNYAKNTGQTWHSIHTSYPENPRWVGNKGYMLQEPGYGSDYSNHKIVKNVGSTLIGEDDFPFDQNNDFQKINNSIVFNRGWEHSQSMSARYPSGIDGDQTVNGLEGYLRTITGNHYGQTGIRRWKQENKTGEGMYNSDFSFDDTYGTDSEQGDVGSGDTHIYRSFVHISFLAPGKDLCPNTIYGSNINPTSTGFIGRFLQGIWGGGCFTSYDGAPFGVNGNLYSFPLEGKTRILNTDLGERPPGPDVPYSVGYDKAYKELHENQWNPCYPEDKDGKTQEFINNLVPGAKFRFEGETRVYTILNVSVKKLYNHTSWKAVKYPVIPNNNDNRWGGEWTTVQNDGTDNPANNTSSGSHGGGLMSVEEACLNYGQFLTSENSNDSSAEAGHALTTLRTIIELFGKADNRRLTYIIELDKPLTDADTGIGSSTESSIAFGNDFSKEMQFIKPVNGYLKHQTKKPIIWETEPKENTDLEIYHEASDAIPTVINEQTKENFAPVGSIIEFLDLPITTRIKKEKLNFRSSQKIERWIDEDTIKIHPGLPYEDESDTEIDYSGYTIKIYKKDNSYNTVLLAAQDSDPGNSLGYEEKGVKYRTHFKLNENVTKGLNFGLSWNNCFSFGDGVESNRIRDGFNEMFIGNGPRVSSTIDTTYQEERRSSGLIYSGIYNADVSINNLNQFIQAEKITKDINPTYGSIQKLFQRRVGLVAFCEDRIVNIIAGKDTLFNADGTPQLISSTNVLGDATPFVGDFGISKNPESFSSESYRAYFSDKQRGAVLRLSMDGLTPISDIGMRDWFRDNLGGWNGKILGTYDEYKKEYNISLLNPGLFSKNIVLNPNINRGTATEDISSPPQNYIENGAISSGVNLNYPSLYTNTLSAVQNMQVEKPDLSSKVTVQNYATIRQGEFYPGYTGNTMNTLFPGSAGWPTTDSTFIIHKRIESQKNPGDPYILSDDHGVNIYDAGLPLSSATYNGFYYGSTPTDTITNNFLTVIKNNSGYAPGWAVKNFQGGQSGFTGAAYTGNLNVWTSTDPNSTPPEGIQKYINRLDDIAATSTKGWFDTRNLELDKTNFPTTTSQYSTDFPEHEMGVYSNLTYQMPKTYSYQFGDNGVRSFSHPSSTTTIQNHTNIPPSRLRQSPHEVSQNFGGKLGPVFNISEEYGGVVFPGIYTTSDQTLPHTQSDPTGVRPNNLTQSGVTGWPNNPHNVTYSSGGDNYTDDPLGVIGNGFVPYGKPGRLGGDFANANNTTIFAGEEIKIRFTILRLVSRDFTIGSDNPFIKEPTFSTVNPLDYDKVFSINPSSNDLKIKLTFLDGSTPIDPNKVISTTNSPLYTNNQNNQQDHPYNTHCYTKERTGAFGQISFNLPSGPVDKDDQNQFKGYIGLNGSSEYKFPAVRGKMTHDASNTWHGETNNVFSTDFSYFPAGNIKYHTWALIPFTFECYVKFKPASDTGYTNSTRPFNDFGGIDAEGKKSFTHSEYFDKIVINNLNIKLGSYNTLNNNTVFFLQDFTIDKNVELSSPVDPGQNSISAENPIPAVEVPGFSTVLKSLQSSKWTSSVSGGSSADAILFANTALGIWGRNTNTSLGQYGSFDYTISDVSETLVNPGAPYASQDTWTWSRMFDNSGSIVLGNGVTTPNSGQTGNPGPVAQTTYTGSGNIHDTGTSTDILYDDDTILIDNVSNSSWIDYDISGLNWVADSWYYVDVFVKNYVQGGVYVRDVVKPAGWGGYVAYADPASSYNNIDMRDPGQELFGYFGNITNDSGTRGIRCMEIQPGSTYHNEPVSGRDITGALRQPLTGTTFVDKSGVSGMKVLRAVFQVDPTSAAITTPTNTLRVQFWNFIGEVDFINVVNIDGKITGGTASYWDTDTKINQAAHQTKTIKHQFSRRTSWWGNGSFKFDKSYTADDFKQKFDQNPTPFYLREAQGTDGYTFRFSVSNYQQGKVRVQLRSDNSDGLGNNSINLNGLHILADANGDYEFSNIQLTQDGTNYSCTYQETSTIPADNVQTYDTLGGWNPNNSSDSSNLVRVNGIGNYAEHVAGTHVPFTGDISNLSLTDATSILTGSVIDAWDIVGFDPSVDNFIEYYQGTIQLNSATTTHSVRQNINTDIRLDESYRINFYHNIATGSFRIYYFNANGHGFASDVISPLEQTQPGYYDKVHTVEAGNLFQDALRNVFVIEIMEANTTGTIDNVSMRREYNLLGETKTLSFSEETKGWVSFKSFIPENGVSLAKQYYTFNEGFLYQHHVEFDNATPPNVIHRNQFYNQLAENIEESSITFIFNQEASVIKTFNTINYEGSQSQIQQYNPDYVEQTIKTYNVTEKHGWYVDHIMTDKQSGTIKEFIEKEGKWFNYIKGSDFELTSTSQFSFQGLGVIGGTPVEQENVDESGGEADRLGFTAPVQFPTTPAPTTPTPTGGGTEGSTPPPTGGGGGGGAGSGGSY